MIFCLTLSERLLIFAWKKRQGCQNCLALGHKNVLTERDIHPGFCFNYSETVLNFQRKLFAKIGGQAFYESIETFREICFEEK